MSKLTKWEKPSEKNMLNFKVDGEYLIFSVLFMENMNENMWRQNAKPGLGTQNNIYASSFEDSDSNVLAFFITSAVRHK